MFEPELHFNGLDAWEDVISPTRNDPFAKVALIGLLGRVRDSSIRAAKLSLLEMISSCSTVMDIPAIRMSLALISRISPVVIWRADDGSGNCSAVPKTIRLWTLLPFGPDSRHR